MFNLTKVILSLILLFGLSACSSDSTVSEKVSQSITDELIDDYTDYTNDLFTYSSNEFSTKGNVVMTLDDNTTETTASIYMPQENVQKVPLPYSSYKINFDGSYTFEIISFKLNDSGSIVSIADNIRIIEFDMNSLITGTYVLEDGIIFPFSLSGENADILITSIVEKADSVIHLEGSIPTINFSDSKHMSVDSFSIDFNLYSE